LTREEVDAAYDERISYGDTKARFIAAILDAEGAPMTFAAIVDRYETYGGARTRFTEADKKLLAKRSDIVVDGDVLRLSDDADLHSMRDAIRKRARSGLDRKRRTAEHVVWREHANVRERKQREDALRLRRAVVAAFPHPEAPTRIDAFDFTSGERITFEGDSLGTFAGWISLFDVVIGIRPHLTLGSCGVDFHRFQQVLDLLPAKKTHTVDGHQIQIAWNAIVEGTLGVSVEPNAIGTLVALYRYAWLHRVLWLMVGANGAVRIPIEAGVPGDVTGYQALHSAQEAGAVVAMWVGIPPEVATDVVRALQPVVRARVLEIRMEAGRTQIIVEDERGRTRHVDLDELNGLDITGCEDFAWRLPVTWRG
jgi:hypothetical protein